MLQLPQQRWARILGTVEGCAALACSMLVLLVPTTPAYRFRIPWVMMSLWAVGMGLGVGGLRFGGAGGKLAGGIAILILGVTLAMLIFVRGILEWDTVVAYWENAL